MNTNVTVKRVRRTEVRRADLLVHVEAIRRLFGDAAVVVTITPNGWTVERKPPVTP